MESNNIYSSGSAFMKYTFVVLALLYYTSTNKDAQKTIPLLLPVNTCYEINCF